jgi:hypothetical protein
MSEENKTIPEEFTKVIKDFVYDLKVTFPEYIPLVNKWWKTKESYSYIESEEERNVVFDKSQQKCIKILFDFCQKKLPPRFFDILYKNDEIFKEDADYDTEFLPNIHFKNLWQFDISDNTRETIWKYLQLILFSIVGTLHNKDAFGDTAKLFETINEEDFKNKLEETLSQMQNLFDMSGNTSNLNEGLGINMDNMPSANDIHDHITGMFEGKLGQLAREIAEETANDLNLDMDNVTDMKDVFNKLIKNPTKLMGLVKNVGDKLDTKIKAGDIKESELIAEATEIMNKMKNMPGMGDIQSMLSKMGMGDLSGLGGKLNMGAMEAQLNRNMKMAKTKERLRAKVDAKQKMKETNASDNTTSSNLNQPTISDEELIKIFSTGDKVERTPRNANIKVEQQNNNEGKKKKKSKK